MDRPSKSIEIYIESRACIDAINYAMNNTEASIGWTMARSIERSNQLFRQKFIEVRNKVLSNVPWGIRPHVLYRVNKYYEHLLYKDLF